MEVIPETDIDVIPARQSPRSPLPFGCLHTLKQWSSFSERALDDQAERCVPLRAYREGAACYHTFRWEYLHMKLILGY